MTGSVIRNKQTGKWDFVFNAGINPLTGKRKQIKRRGFGSKRHAIDAMTKLKAQILTNDMLELTTITYSKYMDEWLEERKNHLQKTTFEIHSIYYQKTIKPRLGHFKIQQMTPLHIQKFVNELISQNAYSEHTVHLIYRIVSTSFKKTKRLTRCYLGFLIALLTGMRQGEIMGYGGRTLIWRHKSFIFDKL